ncbi:MAG: nuclear transport factor 2 family protein [Afipia sp.]|jgi:hypothetical protein|nr:nuclear transport factor 2 family protein [Afipia sp.]
MNSGKAAEIAEQYIAAWNETDDARRNALLAQCWADNGVYVDPNVEVTGRDALSRRIKEVQAGRPGARLEFMSGTDAHHNVLRFLWRLVRADGTCGDTSIDIGEVGPDGRLTKIIGFFGPPPAR